MLRHRFTAVFAAGSAAIGAILLLVNLSGFFLPLRSPDVNGYRDFAGAETLEFREAMRRLDEIAERNLPLVELVSEATRVFHEGIAHIAPADVAKNGLEHYRMRVPASENWILFTLSYLKPDTYRDYEFCSYRRALERGTGRCGQQSLALVSFLSELGVETGFVALGGHALATANVGDDEWYLLDADYGGVIPFDIHTAERDPSSVLPYYWSPAARANSLHELYEPENEIRYGGPEARYARACPIERVAYVLKWAVPALLLLPFPLLITYRRVAARRGG